MAKAQSTNSNIVLTVSQSDPSASTLTIGGRDMPAVSEFHYDRSPNDEIRVTLSFLVRPQQAPDENT